MLVKNTSTAETGVSPRTRSDQRSTASRLMAQSKTMKMVRTQVRTLPNRLGIFKIT